MNYDAYGFDDDGTCVPVTPPAEIESPEETSDKLTPEELAKFGKAMHRMFDVLLPNLNQREISLRAIAYGLLIGYALVRNRSIPAIAAKMGISKQSLYRSIRKVAAESKMRNPYTRCRTRHS